MTDELVTNDKQAMQALKQHGSKIVTAIALVLALFFGYQFYQKNYAKIDTTAADLYIVINQEHEALALLSQNPDSKAQAESEKQKLFANIDALVANHGDSIYAWQALMMKARYQNDAEDYKGAKDSLTKALAVPLDDQGLLTISRLQLAQVLLADGDTEGALTALNQPMPESFEASRQELLGDVYVAKKEDASAKTAYEKAWELLRVRHEERALLKLKMESLGIAVVPIEPKPAIVATPNTEMAAEQIAALAAANQPQEASATDDAAQKEDAPSDTAPSTQTSTP